MDGYQGPVVRGAIALRSNDGLRHHQEDDCEHDHGEDDPRDSAARRNREVVHARRARALEERDLAAQRRRVHAEADDEEDRVEHQRGEDPARRQRDAADERQREARGEQERVRRVGEAVVEDLNPAQDMPEVRGLAGGTLVM